MYPPSNSSSFDHDSLSGSSSTLSPLPPVSRSPSPFSGSLPSTPQKPPPYDPFAGPRQGQAQSMLFAHTVPQQYSSLASSSSYPYLFPQQTFTFSSSESEQSGLFSPSRNITGVLEGASYAPSAPRILPSCPPPQDAAAVSSFDLLQPPQFSRQATTASSVPPSDANSLRPMPVRPVPLRARRQSRVPVPPAASAVPPPPAAGPDPDQGGMSSLVKRIMPYLFVNEVKPDSELYDPAVLRRLVLLTQAACPLDVNELNLRRCAINGDADGIEDLLSSTGVNPNAADTGGWSALILASRYGFLSAVQVLLKHGADINQETNEGWTALMYAVYNKHADIVRTLLEHHTPPRLEHGTKTNAGWTALMYATYIGSMPIMEILTSAYPPANIMHETQKGASAITCARMKRRRDLRQFLEYNSIFQRKDLVVEGIDKAYGHWVPLDLARLIAEFTTFF